VPTIKDLLPKQVVCNERDPKGKICHGKIKRYYPFAAYYNETEPDLRELIRQEFGNNHKLVLLKCEECQALYRLPEVLKRKFRQV
jgi:hypothetical protein